MFKGFIYPIKGIFHLRFFWSDAIRNYFYYLWIYVCIGWIYTTVVITVFSTLGLFILIPAVLFIAVFQVNTWTIVIMRHTLLEDQTLLARKIDETYHVEYFNRITFPESTYTLEFTFLGILCRILKLVLFALLSSIPIIPQLCMTPSIGWQYRKAIYLPNERPTMYFWKDLYSYISFGFVAAILESIPLLAGLTFTSNYLGGSLMEIESIL